MKAPSSLISTASQLIGGRRLRAPRGDKTRPTADRVKEALFSVLGPLDGAVVADLFAGTGALGIEALSRGAVKAVFVEPTAHALEVCEQFLQTKLKKRELDEGTLLTLEGGRTTRKERFRPDRGFTEQPLPAVRAPGERESCLRLLTALASI